MFLSKRSNGIYYLWYIDEGGKKQKISTGCKLKSNALKFLRDFKENEMKRRTFLKLKTLNEFYIDYQEYSKSVHTIKTQKSIENAFREFIRIVGDVRLDKIGVREIESFLAQKKAEASEWTARKYYIHLASAFETAIRWNYISTNPFKKVQKPKTKEVQPLFLTKEEMKSLLNIIDDVQLKNLYLVAVFTGLRLGELLNLQWSDIDFVLRVIHVRNSETFTTKSRKNRSIPMNDQLYEALAMMKETAGSELVFHSNGKRLSAERVSKTFKVYVRRLGLNDKLHFHSLRHTLASWLVQDGVNIYEVQKLLGHSNISVTQVYSHLQPETLHSTVNKISIQLN
ncbi:MAG: tyrosine-type recombinase/integrase [Bacteroidota bacterium]|nr:tyrosine-type recombinase/integrase [Bacteroidota bacterium]